MNATFTTYDGPRATSYTLASQGAPVAVQVGLRATLEVLQVHLGLRGKDGDSLPAVIPDPGDLTLIFDNQLI